MRHKYILFTLAIILVSFTIQAQKEGLPMIGAQVFIEPGQTNEEIENWFRILQEQKMTFCRIRLHETHMHKPDGTWDFEHYDFAFKMAEKYGVKIFATLYPKEISPDWRLEKLSQSKEHLISLVLKNIIKPSVLVSSKQGSISGKTISLKPEETMVIEWE